MIAEVAFLPVSLQISRRIGSARGFWRPPLMMGLQGAEGAPTYAFKEMTVQLPPQVSSKIKRIKVKGGRQA